MTSKEIENQLKGYTDGAMFISQAQLARALGKTNIARDVMPILDGLDKICYNTETSRGRQCSRYFISDVAKRLNNMKIF